MNNLTFAIIAAFILAFGAVSNRLTRTVITAPMVFVAFGVLLGAKGLGLVSVATENTLVHFIAELTLIMVLFTDASRINLKQLLREHRIPMRLLSFGLPLTMVLGTLVGLLLFPAWSVWEALVLAIILAPTDAALGQVVVSSKLVPVRIRQALNVESGLNDGLALPVLLFFVCLAGATGAGHGESTDNWLRFALMQVTLGPLVGVAVGYAGARLVSWGERSGWMSKPFQELSALGLALLSFALAELVGGNGFIAAFCAGLALGNTSRHLCESLYEFAEAEGQLLTLLTFLIFGAIMVPPALHEVNGAVVLYALLSLTAVRMLPVSLALIGLKLKPATHLFVGWFGPRGIASILYGLLILEQVGLARREELFSITVLVVFGSVVVHGVSAWPAVNGYASRMKAAKDGRRPEHMVVPEMPLRLSSRDS